MAGLREANKWPANRGEAEALYNTVVYCMIGNPYSAALDGGE